MGRRGRPVRLGSRLGAHLCPPIADVLVRGAADLSAGTRPAVLAAEPAERRASLGNTCVNVGACCERDVRGQNGLARSEERLGHSRQVCRMLLRWTPSAAAHSCSPHQGHDAPHACGAARQRCQMGAAGEKTANSPLDMLSLSAGSICHTNDNYFEQEALRWAAALRTTKSKVERQTTGDETRASLRHKRRL